MESTPCCPETDALAQMTQMKETLQSDYSARCTELQRLQQEQQRQMMDLQELTSTIQQLEQEKKQRDNEKQIIEQEVYNLNKEIEKEEAIASRVILPVEEMKQQNTKFSQDCQALDVLIQNHQRAMEECANRLQVPITGFKQVDPMEFYDIILGFYNLQQLFDGIPYEETKRLQNKTKNQRRIGLIGQKGKGKTFVLQNILCQEDNLERRSNFQQIFGQSIETKGISLITDKNQMYFDMQAMSDSVQYFAKHPVTQETFIKKRQQQQQDQISFIAERNYLYYIEKKQQEMNDCQANLELFIRNFVISQCQVLILVVSILTFEEQKFILEIMQKYPNKQLFMVHNMQEIESLNQLKRKINSDITNCYHCEILGNLEVPEAEREAAPPIYLDTGSISKFQVQHLVLGQKGKESGRYNQYVFDYIQKSIQHVCHEFTEYDFIKSFNKYFQANIQNHFNFVQSQSEKKDQFLKDLDQNNTESHFKFDKTLLINPEFSNYFKKDFLETSNFIKHPLQINYQGNNSSREQLYHLCENKEEIDLFIPIPFADVTTITRHFSVSKSFEIDYQQFEFKFKQKEENINQEVHYLIDICPITQNLREFTVTKSNKNTVKRYFKEIITDNSKLAGYKHYQFIKIRGN